MKTSNLSLNLSKLILKSNFLPESIKTFFSLSMKRLSKSRAQINMKLGSLDNHNHDDNNEK